jgi:hypothetical protein
VVVWHTCTGPVKGLLVLLAGVIPDVAWPAVNVSDRDTQLASEAAGAPKAMGYTGELTKAKLLPRRACARMPVRPLTVVLMLKVQVMLALGVTVSCGQLAGEAEGVPIGSWPSSAIRGPEKATSPAAVASADTTKLPLIVHVVP